MHHVYSLGVSLSGQWMKRRNSTRLLGHLFTNSGSHRYSIMLFGHLFTNSGSHRYSIMLFGHLFTNSGSHRYSIRLLGYLFTNSGSMLLWGISRNELLLKLMGHLYFVSTELSNIPSSSLPFSLIICYPPSYPIFHRLHFPSP